MKACLLSPSKAPYAASSMCSKYEVTLNCSVKYIKYQTHDIQWMLPGVHILRDKTVYGYMNMTIGSKYRRHINIEGQTLQFWILSAYVLQSLGYRKADNKIDLKGTNNEKGLTWCRHW
jgi:hypothetical protein